VHGPFAKTFAFYEDIRIERPASTGKSCNTFGGLPPIRDLRWVKSEYEYDIRAAKWSAVNVRNDKRARIHEYLSFRRRSRQTRARLQQPTLTRVRCGLPVIVRHERKRPTRPSSA